MSSLILTRRPGEKILIGNDVTVEVLAVNGSQVRIACSAPREVRIDREEIRVRIEREKALALQNARPQA